MNFLFRKNENFNKDKKEIKNNSIRRRYYFKFLDQ
jgi:hypothetical protein